MANIENSIRIASEFGKKWEKLSSSSPNSNIIIRDGQKAAGNTAVYAYWDAAGKVWTIGWGNTWYPGGGSVKQGDKMTKDQADLLHSQVISIMEKELRKYVNPNKFTDVEYAALIDLAYNAGQGNFNSSKVKKAIDQNLSKQEIASALEDSILTAKGVYQPGLKNRRIDQSRLFLGKYNDFYSFYLRNKSTFDYTIAGIALLAITGITYYFYRKKFK